MTTENASSQPESLDAGVQQPADAPVVTAPEAEQTPSGVDAQKQEASEVVYEFIAPEGVELDKPSTEEFAAIAKELNLPKEAAQKVVDLAIKREQARTEAFVKQAQEWENTVKTDKDLGGDKLPETLATCRKAIDLGPPELRELLTSTKLGSHPAVVKWAYAVGKALSEDRFVSGGSAPKGSNDTAKSLYPNQS